MEGRRSGDASSEYVVKNRSSSGCLVVRKKGGGGGCSSSGRDGVGPSGFGKGLENRKKRQRAEFSESGSSDELLVPPGRRPGRERNGLSGADKGGGDLGRKVRSKEEMGLVGGGRKRTRLDVFEFDEYDGDNVDAARRKRVDDGAVDGRKVHGSVGVGREGIEREYDTRSSRRGAVEKHPINLLSDKRGSGEPIRVQGKNGVLKVMVNKKKNAGSGGSLNVRDVLEDGPRADDSSKRNGSVRLSDQTESGTMDKGRPFSGAVRSPLELSKSPPLKNGRTGKRDLEHKSAPVKLANAEAPNSSKRPMPSKKIKVQDTDSEDSDTSLKLRQKGGEVDSAAEGTSKRTGKSTPNQPLPTKGNDGKVKRGTGTEKQKLREKIRQMLLDAGWTIDYRPRRNRDYLDAVYINPSGTAYWSIIKAYDALLKQLNDDEEDAKLADEDSQFAPLPDELLNQLTRKTKKKMEKEMKKKKRDENSVRATLGRRSSSSMHDEESLDSGSRGEKLSSFIKVGGKTLRSRTNGTNSASFNSKGQSSSRNIADGPEKSISHHGRKTRKLGRCTLLVRSSAVGQDSEVDGFVPFTGKRTLLSWLVDCGTVELSQKVLYMNRRRTKVMLEGWITREGIHCGCCSKILTVSKFEIHAGSKLRQPFQNICLESGVSLLECQVDAWNHQESVEQIGFHIVDVDSGDPNDDTCGICGDGGDLICCDGCPSTFHLSCLDIEMLPPGDWHCPNCTCKSCGVAGQTVVEEDDTTISPTFTCKLCAKKCHKACVLEKDDLSVDAGSSIAFFCGGNCQELSEQLQRHLGVKHELEGGFSWSLIHRMETDAEATAGGHPQRVESNSKLAVALSVMDECFLPIVDRRSGINIIRNVLYNSGSNFNRLNYSGFYAVILEKGDEIISAASIRFHGTRLAEMPFIGTRHVYRRQGMCRRLFGAIELALSSFKVERLVIPAISELMNTWTGVFGFTTLNKSLKQEVKSMNMLVFPGVDMLEKQFCQLAKDEDLHAGTKVIESGPAIKNEVATTLVGYDSQGAGAESVRHENTDSEMVAKYTESSHPDIPPNGSSLVSNSADAPHADKLFGSAVESGNCSSDANDMKKLGDEGKSPHVIADNVNSEARCIKTEDDTSSQCRGVPSANDTDVFSGSLDGSCECKVEGNLSADSEPEVRPLTSVSGQTFPLTYDPVGQEEKKMELVAPASNCCQSSRLGDRDASDVNDSPSGSTDILMITSESKKANSEMNDQSCVDAPSFQGKAPAENFSGNDDETSFATCSGLHSEKADGTCLPLVSLPNGKHSPEMESKLLMASLSVPEAEHPDQSNARMPEDCGSFGAGEGEPDSASISVPEAERDDYSSVFFAEDGSHVDEDGVAEAKDHDRWAPLSFDDGLSHDASDRKGDSCSVSVSEAKHHDDESTPSLTDNGFSRDVM